MIVCEKYYPYLRFNFAPFVGDLGGFFKNFSNAIFTISSNETPNCKGIENGKTESELTES